MHNLVLCASCDGCATAAHAQTLHNTSVQIVCKAPSGQCSRHQRHAASPRPKHAMQAPTCTCASPTYRACFSLTVVVAAVYPCPPSPHQERYLSTRRPTRTSGRQARHDATRGHHHVYSLVCCFGCFAFGQSLPVTRFPPLDGGEARRATTLTEQPTVSYQGQKLHNEITTGVMAGLEGSLSPANEHPYPTDDGLIPSHHIIHPSTLCFLPSPSLLTKTRVCKLYHHTTPHHSHPLLVQSASTQAH